MLIRDKRTALSNGAILNLNQDRAITIVNEVGRGMHCIVYDATYKDKLAIQHYIRIKECYPYDLLLERDNQGNIVARNEKANESFRVEKENFSLAYKKNIEMKNTKGLINSTTNPTDIITYNNTTYIVLTWDEGQDYKHYEDATLKELLEHIRSLAKLIQKYHENGYVHLDIKPENILILPETSKHVLLFDFDSVELIEEIYQNENFKVTFSKGFSAPEQEQGEISKIGKHTDIYAVGALTYFKLFGKTPTMEEGTISSNYNFGNIKYKSTKYPPKLFQLLTEFFRKTLSISIVARWNDMQLVINILDSLIELADIKEISLRDSFQYDTAYFVGRKKELEQIKNVLEKKQLVFLSGIGGIGKTELVKQYASKNREEYNIILFAKYEGSIKNLVCNEIKIDGIVRSEEENEEAYFERKINVLKELVTLKDLIIIDNFDVNFDKDLEKLLECTCKFIITTREDFRDYNYPQISVDKIDSMDEIMQLFTIYNNIKYTEKEKNVIKKIIKLVDYHTMTVELIAKYLRDMNNSPIELWEKFKKNEGITNTEVLHVKQRKDGHMCSESVNSHLGTLFDISEFDIYEKEIMGSLSLFAGIRIKRTRFEQICKVEKVRYKLGKLIKSGWIEFNEVSEKVSLHQVIQDVIYRKLLPNASNCSAIVEGMNQYMLMNGITNSERAVRWKVFEIFMKRLSGNTIAYARLCLQYGTKGKLNEAEKICLLSKKREAYDILQKVYRKRIDIILNNDLEVALLDEDDRKKVYIKIINMLNKTLMYCEKYSQAPEYIAKEFVDIGSHVNKELNERVWEWEDLDVSILELDNIYKKIMEIFDVATKKIRDAQYTVEEKIKLYRKVQQFYLDKDFMEIYKNEHFADAKKAYWYQKQIDMLGLGTGGQDEYFSTEDIRCENIAEQYVKKGEYGKAIEYYKIAYQNEEIEYSLAWWLIASMYIKMNDQVMAIKYLEHILEKDKQFIKGERTYIYYSGHICIELIKILFAREEYEKVKMYSNELLRYNDSNECSNERILIAYYYLYMIETTQDEKDNLWQECLKHYSIIKESWSDNNLEGFILEYIKKEEVPYKEIVQIVDQIDDDCYEKSIKRDILQCSIKKYYKREDFKKWHIFFLIKLANIFIRFPHENIQEALQYYKQAQHYIEKYNIVDEYISSMFFYIKAECMVLSRKYSYEQIEDIKQKCNYELLAERKIQYSNCNSEEKIEIWRATAREYKYLCMYEKESMCLKKALEEWISVENECDSSQMNKNSWNIVQELITAYISNKDFGMAYKTIKKWYKNMVDSFIKTKEYSMEERARWTKIVANFLGEISCPEMAVKIYAMYIYLELENEPEERWIKDIWNSDKDLEKVCNRINILLNGEVNSELADVFINIKEDMSAFAIHCKNWKIYAPFIMNISEKYQYQEMEFKKID